MAPASDIVVVGAGIVGCAVAYELARRGASVQVIDDRPAGMGATQAAAGMLAPFIEARDGGRLLDLTARSLDLYDTFVAHVMDAGRLPVRYQRAGSVDVALGEEWLAHLTATHAVLTEHAVDAQLLDAHAVRALEPHLSDAVLGGLFIPIHGAVVAGDLTAAVAAAARAHGARFMPAGRVRHIGRQGAGLAVHTDRGPIEAARVVVAAGSWTGELSIEDVQQRVPVTPVRGQLLNLSWMPPIPSRVIWGERCYVVPWNDRTVMVGATVERVGFDERTTAAGVQGLLQAVTELLPEAAGATFVGARAGLRPGTPDGLPIVGPSLAIPEVIYATGHYRNGILLAPLTAKLVADQMLDGVVDPMLNWMNPARFGAV